MQTTTSESLYRRLQQHLDRMPVGFPATRSGVEIRILERLFTPEEAEIALELSAIPEPAATIHKRFKSRMALPELKQKLDQMAEKGNILAWPIQGEVRYAKLIFAIGMYERQVKKLTPEFERDTRQYFGRSVRAGVPQQENDATAHRAGEQADCRRTQRHHLRPDPRARGSVARAFCHHHVHLPPR